MVKSSRSLHGGAIFLAFVWSKSMLEIAKVRSWDGNQRIGEIKASKHFGLSHDAGPLIEVNFDQKTS